MWLLWFRAPLIIIGSDGNLCIKTIFRLRSKNLNLIDLKSADIHLSGKAYVLILIDRQGHKVRFGWGGFQNMPELTATIHSAIVASNATYLNRAQSVFEKSVS